MAGKLKRLLALGAVVLTTAALAWAGSDEQPKAGGAPKPVITEPIKGDRCVEDEAYMRRNHMKIRSDFLLPVRTLFGGER